jgi:DNA-binding NarL/FixJ family response regulator
MTVLSSRPAPPEYRRTAPTRSPGNASPGNASSGKVSSGTDPSSPAPSPPTPAPASRTGAAAATSVRRNELRRLVAALDLPAHGTVRVVELAGEPGTGKTRLLHELTAAAGRRGLRVLSGRCGESEVQTPSDILASLKETAPPGAERARHGPLDSFEALLDEASGEPLVVILDDFHHVGPACGEFVDHLVRWTRQARILLVVAHRPRQTPPRLAASLVHGVEFGTVERIDLPPLTPAQSAELLGIAQDDDLLRTLHERSEGIPQYLLALAADDSGPAPYGGFPSADGVRMRFAARLLGETAPLGDDETLVWNAAVVLGDGIDPESLAAVGALDVNTVRAALRGLVRRDLLRPLPGANGFALRHPVVGHTLHPHLDTWWRHDAHRRAADHLAARQAPAAAQAAHLEMCADRIDAEDLNTLVRAGSDAVRTEPGKAAHWYQVALRAMPAGPGSNLARAEITLMLARTLSGIGRLRESRDLTREVLDTAPRGGRLRAEAISLYAIIGYLLGHRAETRAFLAGEIEHAALYPPHHAAALRVEYGIFTVFTGVNPDSAQVDAILRDARARSDRLVEVGALALHALSEARRNQHDESARGIAACAALLDGLADAELSEKLLYIVVLAWAEMFTARFREAERHYRRAITVAERSGNIVVVPLLLNGLFYVDLHVGPIDPVDTGTLERVFLGDGHNDDVAAVSLAIQAMRALWTRPGDDTSARSLAERSFSSRRSALCGRVSSTLALVTAAEADGEVTRCMSLLLTAGGGAELPHLQEFLRPMCFELLALAAGSLGDPVVETWAERTRTAAAATHMPHQLAYALAAEAHLSQYRDDPESAARQYLRAADLFAPAGMARARARVLILAASALAQVGRTAEAEAACALAEELADDCSATRLGEAAGHIRDSLARQAAAARRTPAGRRPATGTDHPALSALTKREREIAMAASSGQKTREIAEELHLSPRTVDVHLTRIYRKLNLTSRAALAKMITEISTRATPAPRFPGRHGSQPPGPRTLAWPPPGRSTPRTGTARGRTYDALPSN